MSPPTLAPGDRFGAYEVVELVGAGGMGEVYRARDTRLSRDVALKIKGQRQDLVPKTNWFEELKRLVPTP